MIYFKRLIIIVILITSCGHYGLLKIEGSMPKRLKEVSAVELDLKSHLLWVIEDAGNTNTLTKLSKTGEIVQRITITNATNIDWEDLTTDALGNIYIGDFGNNDEDRKLFKIYKVNYNDLNKTEVTAEIIEFELPKKQDSKDFEAFFIYKNSFYIFSKATKKFIVLKVPNTIGKHTASVISHFNLNGKHNKITAADISNNGKTIVLLNHNKLWKISDFKGDDFFSGTLQKRPFNHNSQKEGICFKTDTTVIITDERKNKTGGNIYSFNID